jgi:acyl-CoA dehydrogenase
MQVLANKHQKSKNFYENDRTLHQLLNKKLTPSFFQFAEQQLLSFGELCAGPIDARAKVTDREGEPKLQRYDAYGEEVSRVIVNEGYLQTVKETYETGIVGYVHKEIPELQTKGNYVYSFAQGYLLSQAEPGFYCPVTLTMATAYLLDHFADEDVKRRFLKHVIATGDIELYEGATFLTERQGGSDVGANVVQARLENDQWRLYGEKYFASNAGMCGVAMVLARREGAPDGSKGLTLFAVPWKKEDGTLNHLRIRRLKDKLGVKAVPSGEVEFDGAEAFVVGDPNKGIYYMLEALNLSRICNAVASLGIMRRTLDEAIHYTGGRRAFGHTLTNYPMVQETISKLKAKLHASTVATFDLIERYDRLTNGLNNEDEQLIVRLLIALLKKETAEYAVHFAHESIELHGGNGYIEDFVLARLLRDAQVLTVWEGPANILAHELIRLAKKGAHIKLLNEMALTSNSHLKEKVDLLLEKFSYFTQLSHEAQTLEAKPLMVELTQLYEAVCAVKHSEQHSEREAKLAEIYIEEHITGRNFGTQPLSVKYFKDI